MVALSFGSLCFKPQGEQSLTIVIAHKTECSSYDEFIDQSCDYMNTDPEFRDCYDEIFRDRTFEPAPESEIAFIKSRLSAMKHCVSIILEPFVNVMYIKEPEWNDLAYLIETSDKYLLFWWGTAA